MLKLYNTATRKKEEFKPFEAGKVSMYTCGPTVYHFAHIGNLRTYIMEDVLEKYLRYSGYDVKRIMNITDVGHLSSDADTGEDKMLKGAKRDISVLNSALGLYAGGKAESIADGVKLAEEIIDSGKAYDKMVEFAKATNNV